VIISPSSSIFEAHFQEPLILENQNWQWTLLHKILNRKIIIISFQIDRIFYTKIRLQTKKYKKYKRFKIVFGLGFIYIQSIVITKIWCLS